MNAPDEPDPGLGQLQEDLVAYLDGELDDNATEAVAQRLSSDSTAREELKRLEQAWSALDDLPQAEVDESFTQTTIEMVALSAEEEVRLIQNEQPRRRRRVLLSVVGSLLLAGLAGYWISDLLAPDPNVKLIQDLPVLERLDEYNQVENMEFLRMLEQSDLFPEEETADDQ